MFQGFSFSSFLARLLRGLFGLAPLVHLFDCDGAGIFRRLHGLAGDIAYASGGEAPLMASELIESIPAAYKQFYAECGRG